MGKLMTAASSAKVRHSHTAYADTELGLGKTSENKGHFHVIGPNGVEEANGHTHELTELVLKPLSEKTDEKQAVSEVFAFYKEADGLEYESRKLGERGEELYMLNKQWPEKEKKALESNDRPALTVNVVYPTGKTLCGYQKINATEIKYQPACGGADAVDAEIFTRLAKNVCWRNNFKNEASDVFEDAIVAGRGVIQMYVDYTTNVFGDIKLARQEWDAIRLGPHNRKDLEDLEYMVLRKRFSKEYLKSKYSKKSKEIDGLFELDQFGKKTEPTVMDNEIDKTVELSRENLSNLSYLAPASYDNIDLLKKNVDVFELIKKKYVAVFTVFDENLEILQEIVGNSNIIEDVRNIGLKVAEQKKAIMEVTTCAANVFLERYTPDWPLQDFPVAIHYCDKRKNEFRGKLTFVDDQQMIMNKRESQAIDLVSRNTSGTKYYDAQTFDNDPTEEANYRENGAKAGCVVKISDMAHKPQADDPVQFPPEIVGLLTTAHSQVLKILNINEETMGQPGQALSGIAQQTRIRQSIMGNEYIFDNGTIAMRRVGLWLLATIPTVIQPMDAYKILNSEDEENYTLEQIDHAYKNKDLAKYDVVVEEVMYSPTVRLATAQTLIAIKQAGGTVPEEMILKYMDMPEADKRENIQAIQQMREQMAQLEQMKQGSEVEKTKISAQAGIQKEQMKQAAKNVPGGQGNPARR